PRTSVYTRRHPARNAGGSSCCYPPPMLEIGAARTEITAYEPRLGMMGWAMLHNFVERVATPLHARAFFLRDPDTGRTQAIAICELAFITLALRQEVHRRLQAHPDLGIDFAGLLLGGTHTH